MLKRRETAVLGKVPDSIFGVKKTKQKLFLFSQNDDELIQYYFVLMCARVCINMHTHTQVWVLKSASVNKDKVTQKI